jgi:hypothetical protein
MSPDQLTDFRRNRLALVQAGPVAVLSLPGPLGPEGICWSCRAYRVQRGRAPRPRTCVRAMRPISAWVVDQTGPHLKRFEGEGRVLPVPTKGDPNRTWLG